MKCKRKKESEREREMKRGKKMRSGWGDSPDEQFAWGYCFIREQDGSATLNVEDAGTLESCEVDGRWNLDPILADNIVLRWDRVVTNGIRADPTEYGMSTRTSIPLGEGCDALSDEYSLVWRNGSSSDDTRPFGRLTGFGSHENSEVKRVWTREISGWVTPWEAGRELPKNKAVRVDVLGLRPG
ncbi:hypothetical protein LguiB_018964 [Lonicera macranthoides]